MRKKVAFFPQVSEIAHMGITLLYSDFTVAELVALIGES